MGNCQFYLMKYARTEYAKKIRKDYEAGRIKERRSNLRKWTAHKADYANTLTTVTKDNLIIIKHNSKNNE